MNLKKKKKKVAYYFLGIKNMVEPLSSSNVSLKLISWRIIVFVCLHKSIPTVYNILMIKII